MNILLWVVFGAIAGWAASLIMHTDQNQGTLMDIIMGIVGSVVGGFAMSFFGEPGVTGFNLYSFVVAVVGACIAIYVGRMLRRASY